MNSRLTAEDRAKRDAAIVTDYVAGTSTAELAGRWSITQARVLQILVAAQIPRRREPNPREARAMSAHEHQVRNAAILADSDAGLSVNQLAAKHKLTHWRILQILRHKRRQAA